MRRWWKALLACVLLTGMATHIGAQAENSRRQQSAKRAFLGTWVPATKENRGLTRIVIKESGVRFDIQAWYLATNRQNVPWPKSRLVFYTDSDKKGPRALAYWEFDTGVETWTLRITNGQLEVEMFTKFLDGRTNVVLRETFSRRTIHS